MTELLPCPFCGGAGAIHEVDGYRPSSPKRYEPACTNDCGMYFLEYDEKDTAIARWNRRTEQPAQWEPLPDGEYGNLDTVTVSGDTITIYSAIGVGVRRQSAMLDLPDNIRLCKREKE